MESLKFNMKQLVESIGRTNVLDESESRADVVAKLLKRYSLSDILYIITQTDKDKCVAYLSVTCEILSKTSNEWIITKLSAANTQGTSPNKLFCQVVADSFVPVFNRMEHYEFDENDFFGVAERANAVMDLTLILVSRLKSISTENLVQKFLFDIIPDVTILALEHSQLNLWTTTQSISTANRLMGDLMEVLDVEMETDLLQYHLTSKEEQTSCKVTILSNVFKILANKLTRESWKKAPSIKHVFYFCVMNTKFPYMSEYLDRILPPSLLFIDDYMTDNKVIGVKCLGHIIECVSAEELRWYGRAEVLYEGLRHQLYTREAQLLEVTIPALFAILKVVEKTDKVGNAVNMRRLTKYDEIFQQLIQEALGESLLSLRRIYTKYLDIFVDVMGITSVRHLKQIIELVENYLEVYDGPEEQTRFNVLNLLRKVIEVTWPRIPRYTGKILKVIVKFLCDLYIDNITITKETKSQLAQDAQQILMLLKCVDKEEVLKLLSSLKEVDLPISCKQVIEVVTSPETLSL